MKPMSTNPTAKATPVPPLAQTRSDETEELRLYGALLAAVKSGEPMWPIDPSYMRYLAGRHGIRLTYGRYLAYVAVREFLLHEEVIALGLGAVVRLVRFAGDAFAKHGENLLDSLGEQLDLFSRCHSRAPRPSELPRIVREAALCVLGPTYEKHNKANSGLN
jgi:hypothetical protein